MDNLKFKEALLRSGKRVILVGNEKGGSGKTTVSTHVSVFLMRLGLSVTTIDLDITQQSLSRYIQNRSDYASAHDCADLPMPKKHYMGKDVSVDKIQELVFSSLEGPESFVVIDTPGHNNDISAEAHAVADVVITPMNDSFVDIDSIAAIRNRDSATAMPGIYGELLWSRKKARAKKYGKELDWIVVLNRTSNLSTKNKTDIKNALLTLSKRLGFRMGRGFSERVIFRELFRDGLTLSDITEIESQKVRLTPSHIAARQELRNMCEDVFAVRPAK